jgi:predicted NBD/HSP70 family sugar kinase
MEALAGERSVLQRCRRQMEKGGARILAQLCPDPAQLTMDHVLQAQELGDREVNEVIEDVLDYLGIALANTINTISPRMVLLDGHMLQSQRNQALILRAVERNMFRVHADKIQFTFLPYSPDAGARGAAAVVARECLLNSDL